MKLYSVFLTLCVLPALAVGQNCASIKASNPSAADGEYTVSTVMKGSTYKLQIYCHDMNGTPQEYITLQHPNYSQYTAGGASKGTSVRTTYTKVRIDLSTMMVDIADYTFSSTTGSLTHGGQVAKTVTYASAADCVSSGSKKGIGKVDLRGTPFTVSSNFASGGWNAAGGFTKSENDQVVDIVGGGYCGFTSPSSAHHVHNIQGPKFTLQLALDPSFLPGAYGDPHIKTWSGAKYDFHGVCDLVLLLNPSFKNGVGLDIHLRTKQTRSWSYVSSVAVRIGEDTLEVMGGAAENRYWFNGLQGQNVPTDSVLPITVSGYPINFRQVTAKSREFEIQLGVEQKIIIQTWNAFVRVNLSGVRSEEFAESLGLMGTFPTGLKMARDSNTIIDDADDFGQEWQVLPSEPKLFHDVDGPQAPEKCEIPSRVDMRRRLAESSISMEEAKLACSRVSDEDQDVCIFDVMATNDVNVAGAY